MKTYHIAAGNQNFFSLPLSASQTGDQIAQRVALIDQLLAAASTPAAAALQNAGVLLSRNTTLSPSRQD